ncbi:peptidoglycan-binding domain-containing protein [Anaerotardibacter muris]|uniref:peptidoglycan-binding domain-containing protein n=1 Tax=Anaerotardibacter muris TaxID=2941505 RepID=UPI00203F06BB|nr:peptidoglycan-binding protein [Anaerotardibacter muris]
MESNSIITIHEKGAAVEDLQRRLSTLGYLPEDGIDGIYEQATVDAVKAFCRDYGLATDGNVDQTIWSKLVDESFELGDRSLYLRLPFFHGKDVRVLQSALSALGFATGGNDGLFGPHTEEALRKFQLNLGLPADGIAGAFTFKALMNLRHSWEGNSSFTPIPHFGFARAAEVLETNMLCLFGTSSFTRSVASRMSNISRATNPNSKVTSAESLLVEPDSSTMFVQITVDEEEANDGVPVVDYEPLDSLALRLQQAIQSARAQAHPRIAIHLPSKVWYEAGEERSAQHYAIVLLDALCSALESLEDNDAS